MKYVPTFEGRLYGDDFDPKSVRTERWVRRTEVDALLAIIANLEAFCFQYARHLNNCQRYGVDQCTCGFAEGQRETFPIALRDVEPGKGVVK